jgi:hypothetical protein
MRRHSIDVIRKGDCGDIIVLEIGVDFSDVYVYTDEEFNKRYTERIDYQLGEIKRKKINNYKILRKWKNDNAILIKKLFPKLDRLEIDFILDNIIEDSLKKEDMVLNNTYQEKQLYSDTLDVSEFYYKNKPATAGNGVLFNATKFNPALKILESFGTRRKMYKNLMKTFEEGTFGFNSNNLKQGNEKVKMNAW